MKKIGKTAMILAISILMLHNLLPHHHTSQDATENYILEQAEADSIIDFIRLAFHLNPGENHLEAFEPASGISIYFLVPEMPLYEIPVQVTSELVESFYEETGNLVGDQLIPLPISFRGPPQLI